MGKNIDRIDTNPARDSEARPMSPRYLGIMLVGGAVLIAAMLFLVYVVDPAQTITPDIDVLYAAAADDSGDVIRDAVAHGILWALLVLAGLVSAAIWGSRRAPRHAPHVVWFQLNWAAVVFGFIACTSVVPWLIVSFSFSIVAEDASLPPSPYVPISAINLVQLLAVALVTFAALSTWIHGAVESRIRREQLLGLARMSVHE